MQDFFFFQYRVTPENIHCVQLYGKLTFSCPDQWNLIVSMIFKSNISVRLAQNFTTPIPKHVLIKASRISLTSGWCHRHCVHLLYTVCEPVFDRHQKRGRSASQGPWCTASEVWQEWLVTGVQCKENIERPEFTLQYTSTLRPRACLYLFPYFRVCVCVCCRFLWLQLISELQDHNFCQNQ